MTRRETPRDDDDDGRRRRTFHLPHLHRPRPPRWQQLLLGGLVLAIGLLIALRHPEALRSTIDLLSPPIRNPGEAMVADRPAEEAVLERRRQGLVTLLQTVARGPLVSRDADRVLFLVDQSLIATLIAQVPREYVVEDVFRVLISGAQITFEDGLALVRLDGRASLVGAEDDVFADVAVFGDLEILREQPRAAVLRARINLIAVDVRRVEIAGARRDADRLVERLGKARLSAFAELVSDLEIPVRHEHAIELPAVDEGPVRIGSSMLPLRLSLVDVKAFKGKLWISMAATFDSAAPAPARALALPPPVNGASPSSEETPERRVARLQHEVSQLRRRFLAAAESDPQVVKGTAAQGHLTAAISPALFEDTARRVVAHYLDRVGIQLHGVKVQKTGVIHKETFLGKINAGDWTASIVFPHVRGTLRAGKPRVRLPGGNRVLVAMPVHLERGGGTARVDFKWDSRSIVNLICRDFEVNQEIEGTVEPRNYPVTGQFTMTAGLDDLRALPAFDDRFRIHPVIAAESWASIRKAIEAQDVVARCGMGLDPALLMAQLDALVDAGFVVKLPRKLFRPVRLPTRLTPTVRVQDTDVEVELTQSRLEAGPDGVWYGVWVKAGLPGPRAAGLQR